MELGRAGGPRDLERPLPVITPEVTQPDVRLARHQVLDVSLIQLERGDSQPFEAVPQHTQAIVGGRDCRGAQEALMTGLRPE